MRPDRIDQRMTNDPARDGTPKRVDHLSSDGVIGKDIDEQANMMARAIYVRDEAINRGVIVLLELDAVAAKGGQAAKFLN
jgi:hypothetical protein